MFYSAGKPEEKVNISENLMQVIENGTIKRIEDSVFGELLIKSAGESISLKDGLYSALLMIGKRFGLMRVAVYQIVKDLGGYEFLYEWTEDGVNSAERRVTTEGLSLRAFYNVGDGFTHKGVYFSNSRVSPLLGVEEGFEKIGVGESVQRIIKMPQGAAGVTIAEKAAGKPDWTKEEKENILNAVEVLNLIVTREMAARYASYANRMADSISNYTGSYTYVVDEQSMELLYLNENLKRYYPFVKVGDSCSKLMMRNDGQMCTSCPLKFFEPGQKKMHVERYNSHFKMWVNMVASRMKWVDGRDACVISCIDITEKKNNELQVERLAYFDPQLDVPNRVCLMKVLENIFEETVGQQASGHALILDIDDFKRINDRLGARYGDELLKQIVDYLNLFPELVGKIFRFGGDEFFIILRGYDKEKARNFADNLLARFTQPWKVLDAECKCTASMGVVAFPQAGATARQLITNGELAVYDAKSQGKNQYVFFDEALSKKVERRTYIEGVIHKALEQESFMVYFQPIYNISRGQFTKAEALLRLWDERLGFIPPTEFIAIAEDIGLITDIDNLVIKKVCQYIKQTENKNVHLETIAINISPIQIIQEDFAKNVDKMLTQYGVPKGIIQFEITENVLIREYDIVRLNMARLSDMGISFALDDFGSGYSGINYLLKLPINCLKIDKSYIDEIESNERSRKILEKIIDLVQAFNLEVVAEGVENASQDEILKKLKCNFIQGYLYSKPLPQNEFTRVIEEEAKNEIAGEAVL